MHGAECIKILIVSMTNTVIYSANKSLRIHCLIKYSSRFLTARKWTSRSVTSKELCRVPSRSFWWAKKGIILSDHFTYQKFRFLTFSREEALALAKICCSDNLDIMYFKSISAIVRLCFQCIFPPFSCK